MPAISQHNNAFIVCGKRFEFSGDTRSESYQRERKAASDAANAYSAQIEKAMEAREGRPLTMREKMSGEVALPKAPQTPQSIPNANRNWEAEYVNELESKLANPYVSRGEKQKCKVRLQQAREAAARREAEAAKVRAATERDRQAITAATEAYHAAMIDPSVSSTDLIAIKSLMGVAEQGADAYWLAVAERDAAKEQQ